MHPEPDWATPALSNLQLAPLARDGGPAAGKRAVSQEVAPACKRRNSKNLDWTQPALGPAPEAGKHPASKEVMPAGKRWTNPDWTQPALEPAPPAEQKASECRDWATPSLSPCCCPQPTASQASDHRWHEISLCRSLLNLVLPGEVKQTRYKANGECVQRIDKVSQKHFAARRVVVCARSCCPQMLQGTS